MTGQQRLAAYQAAIDFKFDHTVEGTPAWHAADQECDRLCYDYVAHRQAERDALAHLIFEVNSTT